MAKKVTILSVFVASPSDVSEERECLEEVIRELNLIWARSKGVQLELIRWETHAYPSVGESPQDVINQQIGDNYDIFIGILWKHFGTPTQKAESGTEEEFNRAYERYQVDQTKLRILFYFKNAPVEMNEIDPEQLIRVRQFQKKLGPKGTLYWEYRDKNEFMSFVRLHLTRHVDDWGKTWGDVTTSINSIAETSQKSIKEDSDSSEQLDEEGFLDLIEIGTGNFVNLQEQGIRLTQSMETLSTKISERTKELEEAQTKTGDADIKTLKRICNHAAENLDQYATVMEAEVPIFTETFAKAIDAYARAASLMLDFEVEDENVNDGLKQAQNTLVELYQTLQHVKESVASFRKSIADTPRMTTKYNRAKRRAVAIVDSFIQELESGLHRLEESNKTIDSLLSTIAKRA